MARYNHKPAESFAEEIFAFIYEKLPVNKQKPIRRQFFYKLYFLFLQPVLVKITLMIITRQKNR